MIFHLCSYSYMICSYIIFIEHQNKHVRMNSEGSCDTEDWSNDAEKALHHRNKLHFKI